MCVEFGSSTVTAPGKEKSMGCIFSSSETSSGMNYKVRSALPCCKRDQLYRIIDYQGPNDPSNTSIENQNAFLSLSTIQERQLSCICDLMSLPDVVSSPLKHCSLRKLSAVGSLINLESELEFRVTCNGSLGESSVYLTKCTEILNLKKTDSEDFVINSNALKGVIFLAFQEKFDWDEWKIEKIILSKSGTTGNNSTTCISHEGREIVICGFKPTSGGQRGVSVHNRVALLSMLYERTKRNNLMDLLRKLRN